MRIYGPYIGKDKRSRLVIKKPDGKITSVSHPRHLMDGQLGITIPYDHDVHHKDENILNNSKQNLEIKEQTQHLKDHYIFQEYTENCKWCGSPITITRNKHKNRRSNIKKSKAGPFCSRICSGKYGKFIQTMI